MLDMYESYGKGLKELEAMRGGEFAEEIRGIAEVLKSKNFGDLDGTELEALKAFLAEERVQSLIRKGLRAYPFIPDGEIKYHGHFSRNVGHPDAVSKIRLHALDHFNFPTGESHNNLWRDVHAMLGILADYLDAVDDKTKRAQDSIPGEVKMALEDSDFDGEADDLMRAMGLPVAQVRADAAGKIDATIKPLLLSQTFDGLPVVQRLAVKLLANRGVGKEDLQRSWLGRGLRRDFSLRVALAMNPEDRIFLNKLGFQHFYTEAELPGSKG